MLNRVLHMPKLKCGLMCLNTLALVGLDSTITENGCTMSDGDFKIHSPMRNGLCIWSEEGTSIDGGVNALFAGIAPKKILLTDWHKRLGHISKNTLLKFGESAIADFHIDPAERTDEDHHVPFASYILGKYARTPFPTRTERRGKPLELVLSDLADANVMSLGGGKYVLTFTDDATNHRTVFILTNKNASMVLVMEYASS
jgi:hypothetical protein